MTITREEIVAMLNADIERSERNWGANNIYTRWERERKEKVLNAFDNGLDPVPVTEIDWKFVGDFEIRSVLYTDGSVCKEVYRY